MKKMITITVMLVSVVFLAACSSGKTSTTTEASVGTVEAVRLSTAYADHALPVEMQLVVGSLTLKDSDYSLDPELAGTLLPYWKVYDSLLSSDTAAQEEKDALIEQIQDSMSPDQLNYISSLQLTSDNLMQQVRDLGVFESVRTGDGSNSGDGNFAFTPPDDIPEGFQPGAGRGPGGGDGQGGGPGGGGVPGGGDGNLDPSIQATMEARRSEMGTSGGFGTDRLLQPLVEALISQLEQTAAQ
jgi:hypothetical protein